MTCSVAWSGTLSFSGSSMDKLSITEACDSLYKGRLNVVKAAESCGISMGELQKAFVVFVNSVPMDPDLWQDDIELSWPWS